MDRETKRDIREGSAITRAVGWRAIVVIVVIVVVIGAIGAAIWYFGVVTSGVKGAGEQTKIVNDGRNRVNAQEWFHTQYNQILAVDRKIDESARALAGAIAAKNETDRIFWRDTLAGQRNRCAQMVGDYNAEANKISRGGWRDPALPYQIDDTDPKTDCKETTK